MIRKTDLYIKRTARVWERGYTTNETVHELVRRETWWLLGLLPLYSRDTVVSKAAY